MRKAVAVPYLIAIILGVVVLSLIVYWFLSSSNKGSLATNESFCRARLMQYCGDLTTSRINTNIDFYKDYAKECSVWKNTPGWEPSFDAAKCRLIIGF